MNWFRLCLPAICIALASPASAQTIRVQSGDHDGFTRLVLPIGVDRDWTLEEIAQERWELSLTPAIDGFDTSAAFDLIQRTRLSDLAATETLSLRLACACDVAGFRHDGRYLVIDISDPDPNAQATDPEINDGEGDPQADAAQALPDLAELLQVPGSLPPVDPVAPVAAPPENVDLGAPNPRLAEAAQIMAEQLARAAASGLLDIAPNEAMTAADPIERSGPSTDAAVETVTPPSPEAATPDPHVEGLAEENDPLPIRAETALDSIIQLNLPIGLPQEEASCRNEPFTVADWSDGQNFNQNLGALRRELYDERDALTVDGTLALVRHYLYFGFGAEATYWLGQLDAPPGPLLHVAAIVDGAQTARFTPVGPAEDCSQGELLWRYLAGAVPTPLTPDDTAAIQRAYGELPPGLRDHLGPRLARQLLEGGFAGTARNVRDVLHRGGRVDDVALQMLDLDLGISLDTPEQDTRQELAEALRDDGGDPVAVLTHALAFDRSIGALPAPSRLVAADALIREIGQGPETDDLWRETLLGHAALGQIDEAINRLGNPSRSEAARAEALTDLIAERVGVGDTAALVILAYTHGRDWRPEGSAAGRIQVRAIATLRDAGLFEAAQILRDVRRPLILPAPDDPAPTIADNADLAWQEQNWPRLAETGAGPHADIATRLAQLEQDAAELPSDLTAMNAAVEDSRTLRSTITELLAQPSIP